MTELRTDGHAFVAGRLFADGTERISVPDENNPFNAGREFGQHERRLPEVDVLYPPGFSSGVRRRSSANMVRPTSLASLALTSGAPTPIDVTGSKAFLLPETLDFDGPTRPLAALERDLGVALHREEEVGDEAKATKGSEAEMTGVVATQPVGSSEGGGGGRPPSPLSVDEGGGGGPTSARGFLEGRGWGFKALFIATTCSAQLIAQGQFGMVVIPLYEVGRWLGTEEQGQLGWMAASYG